MPFVEVFQHPSYSVFSQEFEPGPIHNVTQDGIRTSPRHVMRIILATLDCKRQVLNPVRVGEISFEGLLDNSVSNRLIVFMLVDIEQSVSIIQENTKLVPWNGIIDALFLVWNG